MSLYGGISFAGKKAQPSTPAPSSLTQNAPSAIVSSSAAGEKDKNEDGKGGTSAGSGNDGNGNETVGGVVTEEKVWSSSLRLAPVIRKQVATTAPKSRMSTAAVIAASTSNLSSLPPPIAVVTPSIVGGNVKKIIPPPLTLPGEEDDVNGFLQTDAGRKAQKSSKKKKKRKGKANEPEPLNFEADYDPAKPTDYFEWLEYQRSKREERRLERERERKRRRSSESDYSSDSSDRSRSNSPHDSKRAKIGMFAPPKTYDSPAPELEPRPSFAPPPEESGEDAYARRIALSQMKEETGDEAYARRLALSQGHQPPQFQPPEQDSLQRPTFTSRPMVGDFDDVQGPPSFPGRDPTPPPSHLQPAPTFNLSEAQQKARAIAERLSKLGGAQPAAPTPAPPVAEPSDGPKDFASRFMAKYGWSEGQGLGAAGREGRVDALSVAQPSKEKKKGKGKTAEPAQSKLKPGLRANVVDTAREQKRTEEKEKYGEPSRIVLLNNLVEPNQIDDDLPGEIAEEAGKHGIVERCFIYTLPYYENVEEAVRIFIVFSGMVGAWKSVKEFDGRFFGGRVVKARFYSEKDFFGAKYDR